MSKRKAVEPFTADQNIVMQSGIPVRLYSGGHNVEAAPPAPAALDLEVANNSEVDSGMVFGSDIVYRRNVTGTTGGAAGTVTVLGTASIGNVIQIIRCTVQNLSVGGYPQPGNVGSAGFAPEMSASPTTGNLLLRFGSDYVNSAYSIEFLYTKP